MEQQFTNRPRLVGGVGIMECLPLASQSLGGSAFPEETKMEMEIKINSLRQAVNPKDEAGNENRECSREKVIKRA